MSKTITLYFSASGVTAKAARRLSELTDSDIKEIVPAVRYTSADLDWMDKKSRSTIEMKDKDSRPEVKEFPDLSDYDTLLVCFPVWWYTAPRIIQTFLEHYDLSGKKIVLFATSGGSGLGHTDSDLAPSAKGAEIKNGTVLRGSFKLADIEPYLR